MFFGRVKEKMMHDSPRFRAFMWGRYPLSLGYFNLWRMTRRPDTFTSKIRHRLANDRRQIIPALSDKLAVRDYVKEKIGEKYLTKLLALWEENQEFDWEELPKEYVAKSTHGVGASLIVWEGARDEAMVAPWEDDDWRIHLVKPSNLSISLAEKYFYKWTSQRFEHFLAFYPEWGYRNIPPRIMFEELLLTAKGEIPRDFEFFCFDGVVKFIEVDNARFGIFSRDFYLPGWEPVAANLTVSNSHESIPRPRELSEMIQVAEKLSEGLDFVTVDLYNIDGRIVFGEISFYQGGGHEIFTPESIDLWLGSLWTLPRKSESNRD
jgi:hypothetical protein